MKFVFHSDIEDHKDSTGHKLTEKVMLEVAPSAEKLAWLCDISVNPPDWKSPVCGIAKIQIPAWIYTIETFRVKEITLKRCEWSSVSMTGIAAQFFGRNSYGCA